MNHSNTSATQTLLNINGWMVELRPPFPRLSREVSYGDIRRQRLPARSVELKRYQAFREVSQGFEDQRLEFQVGSPATSWGIGVHSDELYENIPRLRDSGGKPRSCSRHGFGKNEKQRILSNHPDFLEAVAPLDLRPRCLEGRLSLPPPALITLQLRRHHKSETWGGMSTNHADSPSLPSSLPKEPARWLRQLHRERQPADGDCGSPL